MPVFIRIRIRIDLFHPWPNEIVCTIKYSVVLQDPGFCGIKPHLGLFLNFTGIYFSFHKNKHNLHCSGCSEYMQTNQSLYITFILCSCKRLIFKVTHAGGYTIELESNNKSCSSYWTVPSRQFMVKRTCLLACLLWDLSPNLLFIMNAVCVRKLENK